MNGITFLHPEFLYLLFCLPLIAWWKWRRRHTAAKINIPNMDMFAGAKKSLRQRLMFLPLVLRLLILAVLIVAMARPQSGLKGREHSIEGVDIMLALDVSGSMLAEDFAPNRLEAAKTVASDFVRSRPNDRIGVVVFSGESFTQCPLTIDHNILLSRINAIASGVIEDGTAIGDGLATAVNRLKNSAAVGKTIILLTDGVNNMGAIGPLNAADIAIVYGIRVYTIGVGADVADPYPFQTRFDRRYQDFDTQLDEPLLRQIAETTGGQYFNATSKNKLEAIFEEIDKMEKSKIEVLGYERKHEEFSVLLWIALWLFLVEFLLSYFVLKSIP